MTRLYPEIEPHEQGLLTVDDDNRIYWEICGNPHGKPVVVLHGGPGSGCSPWYSRLFAPDAYRIVLLDQRNCGKSTPHASALDTSLASNTTAHLVADIEQLREHLQIERWLVFGGSWGSTLALAYAETYPERVTAMILFGITTGRHKEIDWLFRGGAALFFPETWEYLRTALPEAERSGDIVSAYYRRLNAADLATRQQAAENWCLWESVSPVSPAPGQLAERFTDSTFALAFARIVTHYMHHNLWLEDGILLRNSAALANIPAILVNGRLDFQAPLANAWELKRAWPGAELVIVDNAGHAISDTALNQEIIRATERFASEHGPLRRN
ncbi:MAG TPA: prolyl aminopeptidase [Ktedonobacteraceae bacterium]